MDAVVTRLPALADNARVISTGLLAAEVSAPLSPTGAAEVLAARIRAEAEVSGGIEEAAARADIDEASRLSDHLDASLETALARLHAFRPASAP